MTWLDYQDQHLPATSTPFRSGALWLNGQFKKRGLCDRSGNRLTIQPDNLRQISHGYTGRVPSLRLAVAIEAVTDGAVLPSGWPGLRKAAK